MDVIIITGTTNGLGEQLLKTLIEKYNFFTISCSRKKCSNSKYHHNKIIDLSNIDKCKEIDFNFLNDKMYKNIFFINNAFSSSIGTLGKCEDNYLEEVLNVNILSSLIIINKLIKTKKLKKIINITSGIVGKTINNWGLYCCSKTFIELMMKHVNIENPSIEICNYDPGVFESNIQEKLRNSNLENVNYFIELKKNYKLTNISLITNKIISLLK